MQTTYDPVKRIWSGPEEPLDLDGNSSIGKSILESLLKDPDHISQICHNNGKQYTNKDIAILSIRCAQHFKKLGLRQCEIFALCASNSDFVAPLFFGGIFLGLTARTLDPNFDKDTIKHIISLTKPKIMFCDGSNYETVRRAFDECGLQIPIYTMKDHLDGVREIEEFISETGNDLSFNFEPLLNGVSQTAAILCTSGTTGFPKGICISHESLLRTIPSLNKREENFLSFGTLDWMSGLQPLVSATIQGVTRVIIDEPFSLKAFFDIVEGHKVTSIFTPPSHLALILASDEIRRRDLSSLRIYACAGSHIPTILGEKAKQLLPNLMIIVSYGMSEVCGSISRTKLGRSGFCGQLIPNHKAKVINDNGEHLGPGKIGEICIKPPYKWTGYYQDIKATEEIYDTDGWVHSGDMGSIDESGEFFVLGRKKDVINCNGIYFAPSEIEEVISRLPEVAEVCVFGMPNDGSLSLPAAAIMKIPGSKLTEEEVFNYSANCLTDHMQLRGGVYFIDSIPKTPSGKQLRDSVRKICEKMREIEY